MPSLLASPAQIPAAGAWDSMYDVVQEPLKPRHTMVAKKPAYYGGRKKNLETCTEALGCETGAVDAAAPAAGDNMADGEVEAAECAERKRRAGREEEDTEGRRARRPLPPPLTTLARGGAGRVRMVHERRDGRLAVYAVRAPGVVEAERSGGRLRLRLVSLPCLRRRQEPQEADAKEEVEEGEECGVAKYVRGGRCVEPEGGAAAAAAAAARCGEQWEHAEQAAAFWVATS